MTKFVTVVIVTGMAVVFSASAMAEGWRIGNWEPPKKEVSLVLKDVSLGTFQQPVGPTPIAPLAVSAQANCVGAISANCAGVRVMPACAIQRVGCAGRLGGFFSRFRQARARARLGCN